MIQILVAIVFFAAGSAKLLGMPSMVELFGVVGAGQWLRYAVGVTEVVGAVLLVLPAPEHFHAASAGVILLTAVMLGAIFVDSFILRRKPYLSIVFLFLLVTVAWIKR